MAQGSQKGRSSGKSGGRSGKGQPHKSHSSRSQGSRGQGSGGRSSSKAAAKGRSGSSQYSKGDRSEYPKGPKRRDLKGAAVDLPRWVVEELDRVTPKERVGDALEALGEAANAFAGGRYHPAMRRAEQAKQLAPRDATTRELLGLSAYRVGDWGTALRELRTYRRLAGETTHMPVEMDCLRALDRVDDIHPVWEELQRRGGRPEVIKEGKVVYASVLIDGGDIAGARTLVTPRRLAATPFPEDLRLWYVAARAAALDGDGAEARKLRNAILQADPGFPGIDELEAVIAAS